MSNVEMKVSASGAGVGEAISATEKMGIDAGLEKKEALRLRLLSEELLGMMQSIAGEVDTSYKAEHEGKDFRLILDGSVDMTREMRKTLLSVSSSGENAAAKGFMGKLKDMIYASVLPHEQKSSGVSMEMEMEMKMMRRGNPAGYGSGDNLRWSMAQYIAEVKKAEGKEAKEAWDELEKSIAASIADDISIRIKGTNVTIIMTKTFRKDPGQGV